jgi:hypothetical protein
MPFETIKGGALETLKCDKSSPDENKGEEAGAEEDKIEEQTVREG